MFGAISKALFGDRGLAGGVTDALKSAGIIADPEMELKIKKAMYDYELKLGESDAKVIESVNATMRAEAKSDNWMQSSWRPVTGFTFCAILINNYILFPYATALGLPIVAIEIPANVWLAILAVLGASAYTRGKEKEARVGK